FARIASKGATFVSRGDESGTHQKERALWKKAGLRPRGGWYIRAGAGMGQVLRLAGEKRAYTLAHRGTFLALSKGLGLTVLSEDDPLLVNQYSVIVVSPQKHPHVREQAARRFADFLTSPEGREAVADFGKE